MTKDDIIRMAQEAGLYQIVRYCDDGGYIAQHPPFDMLERFANLVATYEREEWANEFAGLGEWTAVHILEDREAIRARGQSGKDA